MKRLFNFYLEDSVKDAAVRKLETKMGKKEKGALASLLRVLLNKFVTDDSDCNELIKQIEKEYQYSQLKNKRSTL